MSLSCFDVLQASLNDIKVIILSAHVSGIANTTVSLSGA